MSPIRVFVVDDSATVRAALSEVLQAADDIEVVGVAPDPFVAARKLRTVRPDVMTLDLEMPRMDGLTFLRKLMTQAPLPVVVCSTLVGSGSSAALDALACGAVDLISKPEIGTSDFLSESAERIRNTVRAAARARVATAPSPSARDDAVASPRREVRGVAETTDKVIAIGASTGGTEAIRRVLTGLPRNAPGTVVVQHMPPGFTRSFAERMNRETGLIVREASSGDSVLAGHVLIAPGDRHMELRRSGARYSVRLHDAPPVSRHRPSVDVLFASVARYGGVNARAAILTGMGSDGADGLLQIRRAGGRTIGEDERTCVVYGMPKVAHERGGVEHVLPIDRIADQLVAPG